MVACDGVRIVQIERVTVMVRMTQIGFYLLSSLVYHITSPTSARFQSRELYGDMEGLLKGKDPFEQNKYSL